jgi:hypothetical protein
MWLNSETHSGRDRLPPDRLAGPPQRLSAFNQLRDRQWSWLPHGGEAGVSPQRSVAGSADPDRRMRLLHRLGVNMHVGE